MPDLAVMKTPTGQMDVNKWEYPTLVQPKLDGLRGVARKSSNGSVVWTSASGKPLWNLEFQATHLPATGVYDGEIIWPGHPFSDAYGLCKRQTSSPGTIAQAKELQFRVFDLLKEGEWDTQSCLRVYQSRVATLFDVLGRPSDHGPVCAMPVFIANSKDQLLEFYKRFLAAGFEGLMAKKPNGYYHWKRHSDWHRYKPTETIDVRVVAVYEEVSIKGVSKGTLGGVTVSIPSVKPKGDPIFCDVGGGFTKVQRQAWWADRDFLLDKIIEVEFKCRTESGSLREPHFVRLREDKE